MAGKTVTNERTYVLIATISGCGDDTNQLNFIASPFISYAGGGRQHRRGHSPSTSSGRRPRATDVETQRHSADKFDDDKLVIIRQLDNNDRVVNNITPQSALEGNDVMS
jgi:hypothetical protein